MLFPGDHDDRCGRLDRPQIFPYCFHKIAGIACALFRAIGAIIWKPGLNFVPSSRPFFVCLVRDSLHLLNQLKMADLSLIILAPC